MNPLNRNTLFAFTTTLLLSISDILYKIGFLRTSLIAAFVWLYFCKAKQILLQKCQTIESEPVHQFKIMSNTRKNL